MAREFSKLIKSFECILDRQMSILTSASDINGSLKNQIQYVFNKANISSDIQYSYVKDQNLLFNEKEYYFVYTNSKTSFKPICFIGNVKCKKSLILVIPHNWTDISSDIEKYDIISKFLQLLIDNYDIAESENLIPLLAIEILLNSKINLSEELINNICETNNLDYNKICELHKKYDNYKLFDLNYYLLEDFKK